MKLHLTVGNAMDELKDALKGIREHIVSEEEWDAANWKTQSGLISTIIKTNEAQYEENKTIVSETQTSLDDNRETLKGLKSSYTQAETDYGETKTKIGEQETLIEEEVTAFEGRQSKDKLSIEACDEAIALLKTIKSGSSMFIQLSSFETIANTLQNNVRENLPYLPLIQALTQLAAGGGDPITVDSISTLIKELRDEIIAAKAADISSHDINLKGWNKTLGDLKTQKKTYGDKMSNLTGRIDSMEKTITS